MTRKIDVFISSTMGELQPERDMLLGLLPTLLTGLVEFHPWIFEHNPPASSYGSDQTYLDALRKSALYIGIFWNELGQGTIDEFNHAKEWGIDRLIFVKDVDRDKRNTQLDEFLRRTEQEVTSKWFSTDEALRKAVSHALENWVMRRLYKEPERREKLQHLRNYWKPLNDAFTEYSDYLVDHPTRATKDGPRHQRIISWAISICLVIADSADAECNRCLSIEAGQADYLECSHKYEKNLAYIALKRLTPACVVGTEGSKERAEVERWEWYGSRNRDALIDAVRWLKEHIRVLES
jgi:Domain of unknown function (DUF4062)